MPKLEITTMVGCPLMCTFCPQDQLRSSYGKSDKYLSVPDFITAIEKLPRHVLVEFSGMAEPWANPDATEMLTAALDRGFRVAIYTTLYGMTVDDAARVVEQLRQHDDQFDHMCLHLPDDLMNMRGWRPSEEYDQVVSQVMTLVDDRRFAKRIEVMTMDNSGKIHSALKHHHLKVKNKRWTGHSRAGNLDELVAITLRADTTPKHTGAVSCGYTPFYDQNVMLPNGDVYLCCMDYGLKHKLGNLLHQEYNELFTSPSLTGLRAVNGMPGHSTDSLCKSCSVANNYELRSSEWYNESVARPALRSVAREIVPGMKRVISRRLK